MLNTELLGRVATRLKTAAPWLVLAAWPIVLAWSNARWMFDPPWRDAYIYLGGFLRLPALLRAWSDLYFYSRLAFLLPGYAAYSFLPPLVANACLHFGYFYGAVFALFAVLRRVTGVRAALFAAVMMGGYSHFMASVGWDYMDGAGAMYLMAAVWALTRAVASSRPWLWFVAAGLALGAGLHTHFFTLFFWPVVGLYLLLVWPGAWRPWRFVPAGLTVGAGVAVLTALLGLASQILGGPFAFFMSTYNFVRQVSALTTNPWLTMPLAQALASAMWLMPPAVVALAAVWGLGRRFGLGRAGWRSPGAVFSACFLAACAMILVVNTRGSTPILSAEYYVSYLIPFMALAVGALLAPALEQLAGPQYRVLVGLLAVSVPAAIYAGTWLSPTLYPIALRAGGWLVLGGLLLAAALLAIGRAGFVSLLGAVLLFALVNPLGPSPLNSLLIADSAMRRNTFLQVVDSVRSIDGAWPGGPAWLWFDTQEDPAYDLIACALAACDRNVVSTEFPAFRVAFADKSTAPTLAPGRQVVLLSQQPNALALASSAAGDTVTAPVEQFSRTNSAGGQPFQMYFLREPEHGWQVSLPPAAWLIFQQHVAVAQADGSFFSDPKLEQPGFMAFGPYISLPAGQYVVTYWLGAQPGGVTGDVARLDVATGLNPMLILGNSRTLQANDFPDDSPQPFSLTFVSGNLDNYLQFRVLTMDKVPLTLSRVQLKWMSTYPAGSAASR